MNFFASILEQFGPIRAGIVLAGLGASEFFAGDTVTEHRVQGIAFFIVGIAVASGWKKWAASEAEKRISNPQLSTTTNVSEIRTEIVKQEQKNGVPTLH